MDPSSKDPAASSRNALPSASDPVRHNKLARWGWGLLILYLFLLILGAAGEFFEFEAILNLSLFLPPGKF